MAKEKTYAERNAFDQFLCDLVREKNWRTFGSKEAEVAISAALIKADKVVNGCVDCELETVAQIGAAVGNQSAVSQMLRATVMPDGDPAMPEASPTASAKAQVASLFKK